MLDRFSLGLNIGAARNDMINPNKFIEEVGRNYYNYKGSLTTPSCNEAVSWIIMECTIPITAIDVSYTFFHIQGGKANFAGSFFL